MSSLQARMMAVLGTCVFLAWIGAAAILVVFAGHSHTSTWDNKLQAIGTKLLITIPRGTSDKADIKKSGPNLQLREDAMAGEQELVFQVWVDQSRQMVRTPGAPAAPLQSAFIEGFATRMVEGRVWRIFAITDSTGRVQVQTAILQSIVDAEMRRDVVRALAFATGLILLVGVIMWWAVRHSLSSVGALEKALRQRNRLDLTPLPTLKLPSEIRPLVESFNAQLSRVSEAMQVERRFIDDAAHELRTPLSALQAHAQNALAESNVEEKDRKLAKLLAVAQRSTRLSEQLLDLARLDGGRNRYRATPADLHELAGHVVREFEVLSQCAGKSIHILGGKCSVLCDIDEIGILLRNLIDNALRHASAGGRVEVRCHTRGEHVVLEVADDGAGVPEHERQAIFSRFHRVPGTGGVGGGIGLSLVAGIANLHGAPLETGAGIAGRGFCVRLVFAAKQASAAEQPPDSPAPLRQLQPSRT